MSTGTDATLPEPEGLQFDRAEYTRPGPEGEAPPAAVACAGCKRPIEDSYYEINGTILCEPCRGSVEAHFRRGSGASRFLRAALFGSGAALAGAAAYFALLYFFQLEAALVSILVGFLVGKAVRKGSHDRGGLPYQVLAVLLTYTAIGLAYASTMVALSFRDGPAAVAAKERAAKAGPAQADAGAQPARPGEVPGAEPAPKLDPRLLGQMALALVVVTFMSPVLIAQQSVLSLAIIGFALWEAWKFARRANFVVTGPYRVAGLAPGGGEG